MRKIFVVLLMLTLLSVTVAAHADVELKPVEQSAPAATAVVTPVDRVFASWQPFTGGVMMWWSDTDQIWVMTNADARVQIFSDIWTQGMPNPSYTPPAGYWTPVMGFGAIWQALGGPNSVLGWGMSYHVGYDTAARRQAGSEIQIQGPGNTLYGVTIASGANVGTWRVISYG
ncbi:MAG: hypothetical protein K8L99_13715 [Anaerolineae bacterium]|nr:hypothetical protein [Anaerolineae bacterium]